MLQIKTLAILLILILPILPLNQNLALIARNAFGEENEASSAAQLNQVEISDVLVSTSSAQVNSSPTPQPTLQQITPEPLPATSTDSADISTASPQSSTDSARNRDASTYSAQINRSQSDNTLLHLSFDSPPTGGWVTEKEEGTTKVSGKVGQGLNFGPGKLLLKDGRISALSGTLSFWLKIESEPSWMETPIMAWNFDGRNQSFSLFELSYVENLLQFNLYEASLNQDDVRATIDTATWHHIVLTWDFAKEPYKRTFYIDGQKVAEGDAPFQPVQQDQSAFLIGGTVGSRSSGKFVIDELTLTK